MSADRECLSLSADSSLTDKPEREPVPADTREQKVREQEQAQYSAVRKDMSAEQADNSGSQQERRNSAVQEGPDRCTVCSDMSGGHILPCSADMDTAADTEHWYSQSADSCTGSFQDILVLPLPDQSPETIDDYHRIENPSEHLENRFFL